MQYQLWKKVTARARERVEDTVCSIVHNVVSRDVTSEIHTRKSLSFLCDTLLGLRRVIHSNNNNNIFFVRTHGHNAVGLACHVVLTETKEKQASSFVRKEEKGQTPKKGRGIYLGAVDREEAARPKNDLGIMTGQG